MRAEARGLGVGRRLMVELARIARSRGGTRIDLVVPEGNLARGFYARLGLRQAGRLAALARRRGRPLRHWPASAKSSRQREICHSTAMPASAISRHGAGNGALHGGMQSMTFYPITGVGALQAGQTLAGWAVVALFLLALARSLSRTALVLHAFVG